MSKQEVDLDPNLSHSGFSVFEGHRSTQIKLSNSPGIIHERTMLGGETLEPFRLSAIASGGKEDRWRYIPHWLGKSTLDIITTKKGEEIIDYSVSMKALYSADANKAMTDMYVMASHEEEDKFYEYVTPVSVFTPSGFAIFAGERQIREWNRDGTIEPVDITPALPFEVKDVEIELVEGEDAKKCPGILVNFRTSDPFNVLLMDGTSRGPYSPVVSTLIAFFEDTKTIQDRVMEFVHTGRQNGYDAASLDSVMQMVTSINFPKS